MPSSHVVLATVSEVSMWDGATAPPIEYHTLDRSRTDTVKTAAWALRKLRPNIYLPPTYYSGTEQESKNWIIAAQNGGTGHGVYRGDNIGLGLTVPDYYLPFFYDTEDRALKRALGRLKAQKVNLAQAYAERRQTANLVAAAANRIAKAFHHLKHGDMRKAAQSLGASKKIWKSGEKGSITDMWLELQYGWKPLLSDVYGALETLRRNDEQEPGRYYITVRASAETPNRIMYTKTSGNWMIGMEDHKYTTRVRLDYEEDSPVLAALSSVGITDPLSLAWELLPWSFVADWFIPIGDYLQAAGAAVGFTYKGGFRTHRFVGKFIGVDMGIDGWARSYDNDLHLTRFPLQTGSCNRKVVFRTPYPSSPMPSFPGLKSPFSLTHMANAISLLSSTVHVR